MVERKSFIDAARACIGVTSDLLARYRFRIAGTDECRAAADLVAQRFRVSCDSVMEEAFTLHPHALWWLGKSVSIAYVAAAACWLVGGRWTFAAAALCLTGFAYGLSQYVLYARLFDPLFPGAAGCNVRGVMEPDGPADRQVVLVAHHDGPYIFSFLERHPRLAFIRFLLAMLAFVFLTVCCVVAAVRLAATGVALPCSGTLFWLTAAGLPFAAQLFVMMSGSPSPGAGDDLNGVSAIAACAEHFRAEAAAGRGLKRTRLVLLSTDGEEIGQRGAISDVQMHGAELRAMRTSVLDIDGVYFLKDLAVLTWDRNHTCRLSAPMVADLGAIARSRGIALKEIALPFGGGGTDAAAFAVAGVPATTLIAQSVALVSGDHLYHTSRDTPDRIEPEAGAAGHELATGYVRLVDEEPARG
jgi:aminopeptidase YwaD